MWRKHPRAAPPRKFEFAGVLNARIFRHRSSIPYLHMKPSVPKSAAFTLIELLVVISIIALLASIAIPVFGQVQVQGAQAKALAQAKGIFYGLKTFANDHNGSFPSQRDQDEAQNTGAGGGQLQDANEAYANLIPNYVSQETPFGIPQSRYCKDRNNGNKGPDNDISSSQKKLEIGENTYAYVSGLSDSSNAGYPVIADGFASGSEADPAYSKKENDYGAVWKGKKAIVIRCDGSGKLETPNSQSLKVIRPGAGNKNLFKSDPSDSDPWLVDAKVLNPKK